MASKFQKKMSGFLTAFLIGLIVISFMFTGSESLRRSPTDMATVGDYAVEIDEYSREYNRQLDLYGRMMGGGRGKAKALTQKQIRQYKIRENTLERLVGQKLLLNLADELGVSPSNGEVKAEIKELPYFQTGKNFDLNKYKALLRGNGLTPTDFEEQITHSIKMRAVWPLANEALFSRQHLDAVHAFKSQKIQVAAVRLSKDALRGHIPISSQAITNFLKDAKNRDRAEKEFQKRKPSLDKPEQVRASPYSYQNREGGPQKIASQATIQNFAKLANTHTEDPSGKGKGGALGWFPRGKMTPVFEQVAFSQKPGTISKPIKTSFGYHIIYTQEKKAAVLAQFGQHKENLAKEILQKEDDKGLNQLVSQIKKKIRTHFKRGKGGIKAIEKLRKKYGPHALRVIKEKAIDRLDDTIGGGISLKPEQAQEIFAEGQDTKIFDFDETLYTTLIKKTPFRPKKLPEREKELARYKNSLSRRFNQDLIDSLKGSYKIKYYQNIN